MAEAVGEKDPLSTQRLLQRHRLLGFTPCLDRIQCVGFGASWSANPRQERQDLIEEVLEPVGCG